jgi:hypothetical protein
MIKMLAFVRRVPGLSPDEFHRYWRDVHAARIANDPEARGLVKRYELNHRLAADYERERHAAEVAGPQWDGVAVQWFDSLADFQAFGAHPKRAEWHRLDHGKFRADETAMVLTHEPEVIVERPGGRERAGLKLICILRRHPSFELPAFHRHWLEHHGGLFQNVAELNEPLFAYDQNHGLDLPGAEFDGVTEQWFESLDAWVTSLGVASHRTLVEPDVASFLDPASIQYILAGRPTVMIP